MLSLHGIFPPLPTSFNENQDLAPAKMQENIRALSRYDLAGFLVLGSNGELVSLTEKEKQEVYALSREAIPANKIMLAGTGGQSTRETITLCRGAAAAGADAALVLNPSYYRGLMTPEALKAHYMAVADASPIPILIYNMPANSGLDMDAATIIPIAKHENIIGLKDSGGNLAKMGAIRRSVSPDFQILAGSAGFLLPALVMGATGGILALANVAPTQCISIYKDYLAGQLESARQMQLEMIPVNAALTARWGVPALKAAMDQLGLYGGPARSPLQPISAQVRKELMDILYNHNIIKQANV